MDRFVYLVTYVFKYPDETFGHGRIRITMNHAFGTMEDDEENVESAIIKRTNTNTNPVTAISIQGIFKLPVL